MQLTGIQIVERNVITNTNINCIQQQGVDLRVKKISQVDRNGGGYVPVTGKTFIPKTMDEHDFNEEGVYFLEPGYYEVEFEEGCDIPRDATLHIKTRSSLVRCGAQCYSGQFDGGFKTSNVGCFLHVILPLAIEKGARLAQALVIESYPVSDDKMYNGQWQGDKQRGK